MSIGIYKVAIYVSCVCVLILPIFARDRRGDGVSFVVNLYSATDPRVLAIIIYLAEMRGIEICLVAYAFPYFLPAVKQIRAIMKG